MGNTKTYKQVQHELVAEDVSPVLNMINSVNKNLGGRPCAYPNTQQGLELFRENAIGYFRYLEEANKNLDDKHALIADIEGLAVYVGVSRFTLLNYAKRSPEWEKLIEYFKNEIAYQKKQLCLHGAIPAVLGIFDLVNNHSYRNTQDITIEQKKAIANNDELNAKLAAEGLVWNPERQEFEYEQQ